MSDEEISSIEDVMEAVDISNGTTGEELLVQVLAERVEVSILHPDNTDRVNLTASYPEVGTTIYNESYLFPRDATDTEVIAKNIIRDFLPEVYRKVSKDGIVYLLYD